jgi:hypothetical protein
MGLLNHGGKMMANSSKNNNNVNQMKNFLKNGKQGNKQTFSPITNKQDKKFNSHRKMGK